MLITLKVPVRSVVFICHMLAGVVGILGCQTATSRRNETYIDKELTGQSTPTPPPTTEMIYKGPRPEFEQEPSQTQGP